MFKKFGWLIFFYENRVTNSSDKLDSWEILFAV